MTRSRYFGHIESLGKDSDGIKVWRLRWRENGVRHSKSVHCSYREAEKQLATIHSQVKYRKMQGLTVDYIYQRYYLPHIEQSIAPSSRRNMVGLYNNHIKLKWGAVPVAEVKAGSVEEWLQTLSYTNACNALIVLRWIMRKAVMLEELGSSPLEMKLALPRRSTVQCRDVLTSDTVGSYYDAVRGSEVEAAWLLCLAAGLRPGESLGVRCDEPEMRETDGRRFCAIPVNRQAAQYGGLKIDDRTGAARLKTKTSLRWAIMREPYASRFIELCDAAKSRGDVYISDDGFGQPQGTGWLRKQTKHAYSLHGLDWIPIRNLRASYATMAHYSDGLPTEDVARLMGHSKPIITWGTYERPNIDQIARSIFKG